ncbi:MAG: hypothetical protein HN348_20555, partial [Proteobacteria bacterium]|nr:hypothetical protein [Pseudomonadota bacterium]
MNMPLQRPPLHVEINALLRLMAWHFRLRPSLRRLLKSDEGWIDFSVGLTTEDGTIQAGLVFEKGRVRAQRKVPPGADVTMYFVDGTAMGDLLRATPNEALNLLLTSRARVVGNFTYLNLFNFLLSAQLNFLHRRMEQRRQKQENEERLRLAGENQATARPINRQRRLKAEPSDQGVKYLAEPYLSHLNLDNFPRLAAFRDIHFTKRPEVCPERAMLLTSWHQANGFEVDKGGKPWIPVLRQGKAFKHLMESRRPIIRHDDLVAGTTTSKEVGVIIYPDAQGTTLWGELRSMANRELNPFDITPETAKILHHQVFPYWTQRNFREWVRLRNDNPRCQQLDERFALYFVWKTVAISHTICDLPKLLRLGTSGIIAEIRQKMDDSPNSRFTPGPPDSVGRDSSTGNLCFESASVALRPR